MADQNEIKLKHQKQNAKDNPGLQRWQIPPPSRIIQPPSYEIQNEALSTKSFPTTKSSTNPKQRNGNNIQISNDLFDDLGTSHSTRYNTSADFLNSREVIADSNSAINIGNIRRSFDTKTNTTLSKIDKNVKVPSKIYEPPKLFPLYNEEENQSTQSSIKISTAAPFSKTRNINRVTTTKPPIRRPTTIAGKPFVTNKPSTQSNVKNFKVNGFPLDHDKLYKEGRKPTPAHGFQLPSTQNPLDFLGNQKESKETHTTSNKFSISSSNHVEKPFNDLLPPLQHFIQHDVATTQGPPIYFEWKIPSNGLEPPKFESPIGVDGREYINGTFVNNVLNSDNNIAYQSKPTKNETRITSSRSIKAATASSKNGNFSNIQSKQRINTDLNQIRKELSIPEYAFPLESIGRTGYLSSGSFNSFQLKIPERRSDNEDKLHWFGENSKCPECHPSFVKPGTCEPCLRR